MYQTGELLVYGIHGVCRVREKERQTVDRKQVTYLVLEPLGQPGARFLVPTHVPAAMAKLRPMLTREELSALLESEQIRSAGWIAEEDRRKQCYRELIGSGDRAKLLAMIFAVSRHKAAQTGAGRKIHLCDENFLRDAEKLLSGEIAAVMDMGPEEARAFLREKLK